MFTALDYGILCLYFLALTAIGAKFYRISSSSSQFFVGGRAMAWLPVAISVIASDTSAITLLGNPGYTYEKDLRLLPYILSYSVAAWLVIILFLPFYCRLKMYTAYEYLEQRFDVRVRSITSLLFLFIRGAHVSIAMYAPATILTLVSGMPLYWSILLMGLVTTIYTAMGGIRAVIWTDVLQFSIVVTSIVCTFSFTAHRVVGGLPAIWQIGSDFGKWRLFDFSWNLTSDASFWGTFVGGTVLALGTIGTDQAVLQRYFTAKSEEECSRSLKAFSVLLVPYNTLLLLIGSCLFVFYHQNPARATGLTSPDAVLGFFAMHELPRLMATLLVGSVFAASMGVMSAGINSLSTCTVIDFYRRLVVKDASDQRYVKAGRTATVLWGVLTTIGAVYAGRLGALALAFSKVQGYVGGVMLGVFLLGMVFRRPSAVGALAGSAVGIAVVSYAAFGTRVSLFWYGIIGCATTMATGYLVSLLYRRQKEVPAHLLLRGAGERVAAQAS